MKLSGLILFVTSIFLGLAAAATQTTSIRIKRPDRWGQSPQVEDSADQNSEQGESEAALEFITVPIVIPLAVVALAGLLLWFVNMTPANAAPRRIRRKSRRW